MPLQAVSPWPVAVTTNPKPRSHNPNIEKAPMCLYISPRRASPAYGLPCALLSCHACWPDGLLPLQASPSHLQPCQSDLHHSTHSNANPTLNSGNTTRKRGGMRREPSIESYPQPLAFDHTCTGRFRFGVWVDLSGTQTPRVFPSSLKYKQRARLHRCCPTKSPCSVGYFYGQGIHT